MKNQWYGDKRDLVKWTALLHLAKTHTVGTIVQVTYLTPSSFGSLLTGKEEIPIDPHVLDHFRKLEGIRSLGDKAGVSILLCPSDMSEFTNNNRSEYHAAVVSELQKVVNPKIVFLDPDTGLIEDAVHPTAKHIRQQDVRLVWDNLSAADILVIYQHKPLFPNGAINRNNWQESRRSHFAQACNLKPESVGEMNGFRIADDVTFFWAKK